MRSRILLFLVGLVLVPSVTYFVILFARGFRLDFRQKELHSTGILATSSLPENAQVYINGVLKTATNSNFNLEPGIYTVEIKKDSFQPWKKTLNVTAEEVTRASATLFPIIPSLKAITSNGAANPILSPDSTKVAFTSRNKSFLLDLSESPLGLINRQAQEIATISAAWTIPVPIDLLPILPPTLQNILATSAANLVWSPRENKLLYTATASATIPDELIKPLPGSNSSPQSRALVEGKTYVYDVEEDKNFEISIQNCKWFSDSSHLFCTIPGKITILEYDNSNPTIVYQGPMEKDFAYPYPSGKQILILTNLNPAIKGSVPNLYAVSLR